MANMQTHIKKEPFMLQQSSKYEGKNIYNIDIIVYYTLKYKK